MITIEFTILAFGIAKDIIGGKQLILAAQDNMTVGQLKAQILNQYPAFEKLSSLAIAVNNEYATDDLTIVPTDEIVLIPPVSGG